MPRSRSLLRLILHTLGTIVVGQGAQIVAGIVTARAFGPAGKGIISYAGVFVMFGVAAAEGLRNAIAFEAGAQGRPLRDAWQTALRLLCAIAPAGSLAFFGLWLHDRSQTAFLFVALTFPLAAYLQTVNVIYLLRHAIERINLQNAYTVGAGSSLITLVAVVVFHANIVVVLAIWTAGYVAAAVWATAGLPRLLRGAAPLATSPASVPAAALPARPPWRTQGLFALKGGLSAIVTLLAVRIDLIIVGATLPKASLGMYATALAVAELIYTLSRSVTWATTGQIATGSRSEAVALTAKVVRVLLAMQGLVALALWIAGPFAIDVLYGPRFAGAGLLLRIVLIRTVVYGVDGVISYFISVRAGRPGLQFAFEAGTLVLSATLTLLVVGPYGLAGAATAATLSFVVAFGVKLAYFARSGGLGWRDVLVLRYRDMPERLRARLGTA